MSEVSEKSTSGLRARPRAVERITRDEFHGRIRAQGMDRLEDVAFRCVSCGTVQSAQCLIGAGAGKDLEEVERFLGFSCVGRFDANRGCDWTLGGLFTIHVLEVEGRPCFALAGQDEAKHLRDARGARELPR